MTDECWRPVPGYEGLYEVSNLGRVRSLDRDVVIMMPGGWKTASGRTVRHYRGKVLRQTIGDHGYPYVTLSNAGVQTHHQVHVLMLTAFDRPRPPGQEGRHLNDIKTDNRWPGNLAWGTRKENFADRLRNGITNRGERYGLAVTTRDAVLDIRRRVAAGERQSDLAGEYRMTRANVWAIVHRKSWDWI